MTRPGFSHVVAGLAGALLVVLLGFASGPQAPAAPQAPPSSSDEVVRLLRSIDQKLDSRLVENPVTVGQAVHRVGFIAENLGKDMTQLLADTRKIVSDVSTIKSRVRN
jgi:hypothetical protein